MMKHPQLHDLPTVIQGAPALDGKAGVEGILADGHWLDAVALASLAVGKPLPEAKREFEALLKQEGEGADRAVLLTALARCHNSQMRLLEGARLLREAWTLLGETADDRRVFLLLEMGRFLLLTGNLDAARLLLADLPARAERETLQRLAIYYQAALRCSAGDPDAAAVLEESLEWFRAGGHWSTVAAHRRMLSALSRAAGDAAGARAQLDAGLAECREPALAFCRALFHNDRAVLLKDAGDLAGALAELDQAQALAEFPYSRIDALDLKGRFLLEAGRPEEAAELLTEALAIAREAGTLIILPSLAYHIGLCHERREQATLARHFFEMGYAGAMELLEHGFPATETRLKAVAAHVHALSRSVLAPGTAAALPSGVDPDFSFVGEASLREIRTLFQTALLDQAVRRWGTMEEGARRLGLAPRTAGNVRRRYRELGRPDLPAQLDAYVRALQDLDWKDSTQSFDDTLLLWLAERYHGRLKALSERLDLSYAHLSSRLAQARRRRNRKQENPAP